MTKLATADVYTYASDSVSSKITQCIHDCFYFENPKADASLLLAGIQENVDDYTPVTTTLNFTNRNRVFKYPLTKAQFSKTLKTAVETLIFYLSGATNAELLYRQNPDHPIVQHATSPDSLVNYMAKMEEAGIVPADRVQDVIASVQPGAFFELGPTPGTLWRRWPMFQPSDGGSGEIHPFAIQDKDVNDIPEKFKDYLVASWKALSPSQQAKFHDLETYLKLYLCSETDQLNNLVRSIKAASNENNYAMTTTSITCNNSTYDPINALNGDEQPYAKRAAIQHPVKLITASVSKSMTRDTSATTIRQTTLNMNVIATNLTSIESLVEIELLYTLLFLTIADATKVQPGNLTFFIDRFVATAKDIDYVKNTFDDETVTVNYANVKDLKDFDMLEFVDVNSFVEKVALF